MSVGHAERDRYSPEREDSHETEPARRLLLPHDSPLGERYSRGGVTQLAHCPKAERQ
jgi:hypothetical protein